MQKNEDGRNGAMKCIKSAAFGTAVATAALILLLGVSALLISKEILPERFEKEIVTVVTLMAVSAGSFAAAERAENGKMVSALLCGTIAFCLIILMTALGGEGREFSVMTLKSCICCICGGAVGGVLATARRPRRKAKRKRKQYRV